MTRVGLAAAAATILLCPWKDQRERTGACSTLLLQIGATKIPFKKRFLTKKETWHLVSHYTSTGSGSLYSSKNAKNIIGYSTTNSKSKRLGPDFHF